VVRRILGDCGGTSFSSLRFSSPSIPQVLVNIHTQSPDIGQGVHGMGAQEARGDRRWRPGPHVRLCHRRDPELMPLTHVLATKIGNKLTEVRKNGVCG